MAFFYFSRSSAQQNVFQEQPNNSTIFCTFRIAPYFKIENEYKENVICRFCQKNGKLTLGYDEPSNLEISMDKCRL